MTCDCDKCIGKPPLPHDPFRSRPSLSMWAGADGKVHYKEHLGRPGPLHPDYVEPGKYLNWIVLGMIIGFIIIVLME